MQVAREHLLAGARFTGNEDRGIRRGDLIGQLYHPAHRFITVDERMVFFRDGLKHGGYEFRIRRQSGDYGFRLLKRKSAGTTAE